MKPSKKLKTTKDYLGLTKGSVVLLTLLHAGKLMDSLSSLGSLKRAVYPEATKYYRDKNFNQLVRRLEKKGYIKQEYKEAKKILKLTKKGELEAIFKKEMHTQPDLTSWDGQWSIISFDIPERANSVRVSLRRLLHTYGFQPLQASVYISPYSLPESAWNKLKETGLDRYICAFQVTRISRQKELLKLFNLHFPKT